MRAGDIYEIIGCGAEELQTKGGLQPESIDTIITVQCLCSIPTPQLIIKNLYPLLKPGGQWLVYEHVRTKYQGDLVGYWWLAHRSERRSRSWRYCRRKHQCADRNNNRLPCHWRSEGVNS